MKKKLIIVNFFIFFLMFTTNSYGKWTDFEKKTVLRECLEQRHESFDLTDYIIMCNCTINESEKHFTPDEVFKSMKGKETSDPIAAEIDTKCDKTAFSSPQQNAQKKTVPKQKVVIKKTKPNAMDQFVTTLPKKSSSKKEDAEEVELTTSDKGFLKNFDKLNKLTLKKSEENKVAKVEKTEKSGGGQLKKAPVIPGISNFLNMKTGLTTVFFESSDNFLQAQELLLKAYGKNVEAAQVRAAIEYAKDSNNSENDRIKNSIKATTEASAVIEKEMQDENKIISAEGKVIYAQSLPYAMRGTVGAFKLAPETMKMTQQVKASPIRAASQLGGFIKVLPHFPKYVKTVNATRKLVFSGAKANDIEGHDKYDKELGELGEL